jgi:hypothetical protein
VADGRSHHEATEAMALGREPERRRDLLWWEPARRTRRRWRRIGARAGARGDQRGKWGGGA